MKIQRRTYKETYFWIIVLCLILTVVSEFTGISVKEMTAYADDTIKKTYQNFQTLTIWIAPVLIIGKKIISEAIETFGNKKGKEE
jgi:uncharacterized membrane protein YhaH (DUF805 family)